jgi:predicted DNA-binding protein (UPF0251 family)
MASFPIHRPSSLFIATTHEYNNWKISLTRSITVPSSAESLDVYYSLWATLDLLWAYAYNRYMSRPKKCRCINCTPGSYYFKPRGIPLINLEEVTLTIDELEAIRLADYEGLYHEEAAKQMNISRATFGRILVGARHKTSGAIIHGKALKIESNTQQNGGNK